MAQRGGSEGAYVLPQLRIDELIDELQARLSSVRSSRDRVQQLLQAVVGIGSGLDLEQALTRIVEAATSLVDAKYGALGVIGSGERLDRFITVGLSPEQIAAIGPYPEGHGLLGELIRHPAPLRSGDLSTHPNSYGFPANHPPMHSFLGVPVRVRDTVFGNLYLTEKQGGAPFDADDEAVLTALAAAAGVAIDNVRLYDESRRRQAWLEATAEMARGLLSGRGPHDALKVFAGRVRGFADAALVAVALPEAEGEDLLITVADGEAAPRLRGRSVPVEGTLLGEVFKSGEPAQVPDLGALPQQQADPMRELGIGGAALAVPIGSAGQVRGVLLLVRDRDAPPIDESMATLTADLALQAAIVLELAERRRDSEMLSLYADRDRIGRDLHDLAIQRLFATSMALQGTYKITEKPAVARRIAQAIEDLDSTIKVIRSTIFALHARELDSDLPSLRAQVIAECEQAAGVLGFPPAVRFAGPVDTLADEQAGDHLLAVLREALSNAARHAQARAVEVDLAADGSMLSLTVTDDGVGITAGGRSSGLSNMRERAAALGGSFEAGRGPSGGTAVVWRVPLTGADGPSDAPARAESP